jgi:hypothetical protein
VNCPEPSVATVTALCAADDIGDEKGDGTTDVVWETIGAAILDDAPTFELAPEMDGVIENEGVAESLFCAAVSPTRATKEENRMTLPRQRQLTRDLSLGDR